MPADGPMFRTIIDQKKTTDRTEANKAPAGIIDAAEDLLKKYRGDATAVKAGLQNLIIGSVGAAAALSCIPFEMNFGSVFAGSVLRDLLHPGVAGAITGPLSDYLDNIFPTRELNVRMLVTGIEKGALTDDELIDTAVDGGLKDKEIRKLLKIAKVARFDRETDHDYDLVKRYEDAIIASQLAAARYEVDQAIADRNAEIKVLTKQLEQAAMEAAAT